MRILGISAFYHDSAAALIEDGAIVAAAQEERFSRIKHDASFPCAATAFCLRQSGGPLDAVVYYEKPLLKFERILTTALAVAPRGLRAFAAAIPEWVHHKLWLPSVIEDELSALGAKVPAIHFAGHHHSHAASAFFPSPFERAAILTLDGVGEWATTALGRGSTEHLELLRELPFPHSLGLLYSAFTYYCGFRVNSGEYKLMGLAPYGQPRYVGMILEQLIDLRLDGSFRLNLDYFGYLQGERMTNERFASLLGGPVRDPAAPLTPFYCDVARSIQEVTELTVLRLARTLHAETAEENLCLAGGVALNCVANARLLREGPFRRLWIQPAAGDAGGAVGAALAFYHLHHRRPRHANGAQDGMRGAFLGPEYSEAEMAAALADAGLPVPERREADLLATTVAERLDAGQVVGFFQGRAEFGPRALGARSILADARAPDMQRRLNLKIKFRESFRPFAPVVLAERAREWFDLIAPSPYMLLTAPVAATRRLPRPGAADLVAVALPLGGIAPEQRKSAQPPGAPRFDEQPEGISGSATAWHEQVRAVRSEIPAVTHVDYSARVQTVDRTENPVLHQLLRAFEARTGCPVLVNTSFNVRGEPPVCHPREAIACFLSTEMDCLALGPYFLEKRLLPPQVLSAQPARPSFALD